MLLPLLIFHPLLLLLMVHYYTWLGLLKLCPFSVDILFLYVYLFTFYFYFLISATLIFPHSSSIIDLIRIFNSHYIVAAFSIRCSYVLIGLLFFFCAESSCLSSKSSILLPSATVVCKSVQIVLSVASS